MLFLSLSLPKGLFDFIYNLLFLVIIISCPECICSKIEFIKGSIFLTSFNFFNDKGTYFVSISKLFIGFFIFFLISSFILSLALIFLFISLISRFNLGILNFFFAFNNCIILVNCLKSIL